MNQSMPTKKECKDALLAIEEAKSQIQRLKGYARLTVGMKYDFDRWSRRRIEAEDIVRRYFQDV